MKSDIKLTKEIESGILEQGADLVGVAPMERFAGAPKGYGPLDYMPDAKNVISIAMHIAGGVCDVWGEYTEPGKTIGPYLFYGYGLTNLELGRIANWAARRLEFLGYKSLIFPPTWNVACYRGRGLRDGELKADFSHRHAAVAAGLGELGWNGLAMTPVFGARVRFNSVITDAPLVPTPMYQGPALCQPERCRYLCARVCPAQALPLDRKKEVSIGERHFTYSHLDRVRCLYALTALVKGSGSYGGVEIPPGPGQVEHLSEAEKQRHPWDQALRSQSPGIICGNFCGRCFHQCPSHIYSRAGVKPRLSRKE